MPKPIGGHFSRESHHKSHIKEYQPPVYRGPSTRNQWSVKERSQEDKPLEVAQIKTSLIARQKMREAKIKVSSVARLQTLYGKTIVIDLRDLIPKIVKEDNFTLLVAEDRIPQVPEVLLKLLEADLSFLFNKKRGSPDKSF